MNRVILPGVSALIVRGEALRVAAGGTPLTAPSAAEVGLAIANLRAALSLRENWH